MSLKQLLSSMLKQVDGACAIMLMGYDCISIEEAVCGEPGFDVQSMVVECGTVIREIRRSVEVVGAGVTDEIIINTTNSSLVVRLLCEEYFVAFVLHKGGSLGKARYLLRLKSMELQDTVG